MAFVAEEIAGRFEKAWAENAQFDFTGLAGPQSAADAYRIQDIVFESCWRGRRASAWKAGASGPGVVPSAAPIGSVNEGPATLAAAPFHMLCIEAEVAFRFGRDLPAPGGPWTERELADAVDEVLVTIEICDTRLANWKAAPPLWRLADFQLNGALVTGSGTRDWRKIDFAIQRAELWINGAKIVEKSGSHPLGNPFRVLPWAVEHCALRGGGLRSGDLVTTGSWTGMEFVAPGDAVLARFPGIGEASVRIG